MNAVADEYLRAKAALVGVKGLADGQVLALGLAQSLGDLGSFGSMTVLTREAEALIGTKAARAVRPPPREHVTFAVPPTPAVAERLDALGVSWGVKAFEESKHPRNRLGEWAHTGGGAAQMPSEWPERGLDWEDRWAKLPDTAPVWVFHSTDRQTAERFLADGIDPANKPTNLNRQRYEAGDLEGVFFQPGAGLGAGLPVALQPGQTGGYGRQLLAIRVRKGDIQVSPEQQALGETSPGAALRVGDAMTSAVIPPSDVVAVGEAGRDPSAVDVAGQLRDRGLLAKAVATATWNPTLHPRDAHGRWAHAGTDLGRLFGQLDYSPDTLASHEGDFERDPDGAPVRWRQAHLDLVTAALRSFRRSPFAVQVHMNSAFEGRPQPPSGVGQRARAEAAALLWELEHGSRPNPVPLYRASAASATAPDAWTEDLRVAQHLADLAGGEVVTLPRGEGRGVRIDDYVHSGLDLGQRQWAMLPQDVAGLLQPDALTANRKAVGSAKAWDSTKHPRDRLGRFLSALHEALSAGRSRAHYGGLSAHIERQGGHARVSIGGLGGGGAQDVYGTDPDGLRLAARAVIRRESKSEPLDSTESVGVMTVRDFVGAFDGFENGGMTAHVIHAEVRRSDYLKPDAPKPLEVQGVIHDADGNEVGMFTRNLYADRVYHNLLYIHPEYRGRGFATALNLHAEQVYRQHEVKQIELRTENVGGYAWARAGYEIKQGPEAENDPLGLFAGRGLPAAAVVLAGMFRNREAKGTLEGLRSHVSPALWDKFKAGFALKVEEQPTYRKPGERESVHMPDPANAASASFQKVSQVAQFGIEEPWTDEYGHTLWLGKAFLIGMEWSGVKSLD